MITTRPYRSADKPAFYEMLAEVWPDETDAQHDRRWWWQRDESPLWLAVDDEGTVAGMCGHMPFTARADGLTRRGAWIVDFFVRASFQGQGIGKRLVRAIEQHYDFLASLNQTDAAYATFSRSGWTQRKSIPLLIAASPGVYRAAAWLRLSRGITLESGPAVFDASFDALWARAGASVVASLRTQAVLRERFGRTDRDYTMVRAVRDGELAGYFVLRVLPPGSIRSFARFPIMFVSDYLTDPADAGVFRALMTATAREAAARGMRFIVCMTNHEAHRSALTSGGFLWHETPWLGTRLNKLSVGFTMTPSAPEGRWHLTPFDCDLDILFGAKV